MRGTRQRHALLIISDGEDNDSRYGFDELRRRLRESDAIIYAVGIDAGMLQLKGRLNGREVLDKLT